MNRQTEVAGLWLARALIAAIYLFSGVGKLMNFDGTVAYIASKQLPLPAVAAGLAALVEVGGSLMLLIGFRARVAAAAMVVFTLAAAFLFHDFWHSAPDQAQNQMIHFMKNLAMAGGLLLVVLQGAEPRISKD